MTNVIVAAVVAGILSAVSGHFLIPVLRALKAGQSIREVGPTWHNYKAGTPMMGGLMFIFAAIICLLCNIPFIQNPGCITLWASACASAWWAFWMTFAS